MGLWRSRCVCQEFAAFKSLHAAGLIDSNVVGYNVGSEASYRKDVTELEAVAYFKQFKTLLASYSISAPVSITDIIDTLVVAPSLLAAVDVVTVNAFPFWELVPVEKAAAHFHTRIAPLLSLVKGKKVIISETGWASAGTSVGASRLLTQRLMQYVHVIICCFFMCTCSEMMN